MQKNCFSSMRKLKWHFPFVESLGPQLINFKWAENIVIRHLKGIYSLVISFKFQVALNHTDKMTPYQKNVISFYVTCRTQLNSNWKISVNSSFLKSRLMCCKLLFIFPFLFNFYFVKCFIFLNYPRTDVVKLSLNIFVFNWSHGMESMQVRCISLYHSTSDGGYISLTYSP